MAFEFDRYINGQLMAEGVTIERQKNLADAMREAARIASRGPNGEVPVLVLRALAERAGGVNEDALRALAQAYDREDSAQRGEPDPWNLDDPGDIGDSDTWVSERLACARVAAEAFLSALEPAAPEGRRDNEPRAYIVHAPEDDYYGTGPDRLQFHPLAQHDMDNGYRQTPLYGRPAEQAVTEAMVEAVVKAIRPYTLGTLFLDEHQILVRAALKAAMEADR